MTRGKHKSDREIKMTEVNVLFRGFNIPLERQRLGKIWASKDHECPTCKAPAGKTCVSLAKGAKQGTPVKWPHERRIDLDRLLKVLYERMS